MRGALRLVDEAIAGGDKAPAHEALRAAQPEVARGAGQKLLHRNTAARENFALGQIHQSDAGVTRLGKFRPGNFGGKIFLR